MKTFEEMVEVVIEHEGGSTVTDTPEDSGGLTKYGISQKAYPKLDIRNITKDQAISIYYKDYWKKGKVELLPERLWMIYFDMVVNMGRSRATKVLQEACNHKNKNMIKVDGMIGKNTAKASQKVEYKRVQSFRVKFYADLIHRKPALIKFWYGWYKRAILT